MGIDRSWRLFVESSQMNSVSELKYGELRHPKWIRMVSEKIRLVDLDIEDIPYIPYPANDGEEVKKEIQHIIDRACEAPFGDDELATLDRKVGKTFLELLDRHGISYDKIFLQELVDDFTRIVLKLKVKYNRPRPYQLAPMLGYKFSEVATTTDNSPSYPSGHTLIAWSLALHLSSKYPQYKADFYDIAGKIEDSRIVRGAHYLSDNVFAKMIARKYVVPNIKGD